MKEKLFSEIRELLWDNVDQIIIHREDSTEYILSFDNLSSEVKLVRAIFYPTDLDNLVIDGIMRSESGLAVSCPATIENFLVVHKLAKRYGLKIKQVSYL